MGFANMSYMVGTSSGLDLGSEDIASTDIISWILDIGKSYTDYLVGFPVFGSSGDSVGYLSDYH